MAISELPDGFEYPAQLVRMIDLQLTRLEPWWIIEGDLLARRYAGLKERYPDRALVPFATRQDNDDIACFDIDKNNVSVVHDFASPGYERRAEFSDFSGWLRAAIEDFIEFD